MIRITIIGAGSVEFTRSVLTDLCSYPELRSGLSISLHDIDPGRLAYAERAAESIIRRTGAGYQVESSTERRRAVAGAERFRCQIDERLRRNEENSRERARMEAALDAGEEIQTEPDSELAAEIIRSVVTDAAREVYTNVRNDGLVDGLPASACVEVPALVNKNGVQPTKIGALPPQCLAVNRTFLNVVELTVRAALEERRDLVYQAALVDPNAAGTLTTEQITAMCDDMIEAHGELMPAGIATSR